MTTFVVDYSYSKNGSATGRTRIQGNTTFHLQSARSEFAVMNYLRNLHPGAEINIYRIDWK